MWYFTVSCSSALQGGSLAHFYQDRSYLIFVIFFTLAKFLENKIYTEKRVNYDKIHSKLPFFCVITAKYTVNCQFFALNLSKFTPAKKNLHGHVRGDRDKYQVCIHVPLF